MSDTAVTSLAIVGDVGGTNCRFALCDPGADVCTLQSAVTLPTRDFTNPADAVAAYLRQIEFVGTPAALCIAVAGPTDNDIVQLTNVDWRFSKAETARQLGIERFLVANDLEAAAHAALEFAPDTFATYGPPAPRAFGPTAIIAPGTGLGVALAVPSLRTKVLPTEGGHTGFAPQDEFELALAAAWLKEFGRLTNEHILSGPGWVRLYRFVTQLRNAGAEPLDGAAIMVRALSRSDPHCVETAERFSAILAAFAGDIVLAQGASAVVLAGSLVTDLRPYIACEEFRRRFSQRGPGGAYLESHPVMIAARSDLGLIGAWAYLRNLKNAGS